jgi:hypothetical protein
MKPSSRLLRTAIVLLSLALCAGAVNELYTKRALLSERLGHYSPSYLLALAAIVGILAFFLFSILAIAELTGQTDVMRTAVLKRRAGLGKLRWPAFFFAAIIPALLLLYTPLGTLFSGLFFRTILWLSASLAAAFLLTREPEQAFTLKALGFGAVLAAGLYYLAAKLTFVTNYPFMLIWSEGNRFYDYSVLLGQARYSYPGELSIPYGDPGRYLLWGLPFAMSGTPIWVHRLWDALLWTLPYLLLGILLTLWGRLKGLPAWIFALWCVLFLAQGPVYPTLILAAILVVFFVRPGSWISTLIGAAAGGYYAAISRFTWLPTAATWTGFILLSEFELAKGENLRRTLLRLAPIAAASLVGLGAAILANPALITPEVYSSEDSLSFSQPLLWYRLFPNSTYTPGILLSLAIAAGPLILLLVWSAWSRKWRLNWIQALAMSLPCLIFLGGGLVASVKIGGGSNLHNLDMLLVSLVILAGLALKRHEGWDASRLPAWIKPLVVLVVLLPAWKMVLSGSPLNLPDPKTVELALESAHAKATRASERGQVLFIDHRQLLAFQLIRGVPLVPEYEKKYMMDQAMAGNATYFEDFYRDLANHRFSLIVSQPMFTSQQASGESSFPEENNAWVKWVAEPLLCYYAPTETIPEVQIQFLVPRSDPQGCP